MKTNDSILNFEGSIINNLNNINNIINNKNDNNKKNSDINISIFQKITVINLRTKIFIIEVVNNFIDIGPFVFVSPVYKKNDKKILIKYKKIHL